LDAGAKLIRGQFDTERAYYAALTDQIRNILEYYSGHLRLFHHVFPGTKIPGNAMQRYPTDPTLLWMY